MLEYFVTSIRTIHQPISFYLPGRVPESTDGVINLRLKLHPCQCDLRRRSLWLGDSYAHTS